MASCTSCSTSAQAYQQVQQSVQQQFQPKNIAQYVKEAAQPQQAQESNALNTSGDRGRALNITA